MTVRVGEGKLEPKRYWDVPFEMRAVNDEREAQEELIQRLKEAVDIRLLAEVPLGEVSERYRLWVRAAGTLRREVTVASPSWTYTGADQAADGVGASFSVEVAQLSDRVGPGHLARIEIDG